jgi:hypothetical protein
MERPMLYSTPMVKAILEDRKLITRRVVKGMALDFLNQGFTPEYVADSGNAALCPYGKVGDIIWVRETWAEGGNLTSGPGIIFKASNYPQDFKNSIRWKPSIHMKKEYARIWLEITGIRIERLQDISPADACDEGIGYDNINLEAFKGGELEADFTNYAWKDDPDSRDYYFPTYASCIDSFMSLWAMINGWESVDANPWVWVVKFKVLSKTGRP